MLDVKKLLKKAVKRKIRVTDALIVGFLISGNLLYAENSTFTNDEIITNENENGYMPPNGTGIFNNYGTISGSQANGLDASNIGEINNYGIISGSKINTKPDKPGTAIGDGLKLSSTAVQTVTNYGVISGSVTGYDNATTEYSGRGISGAGTITVENNGIIIGSSEAVSFGTNVNPGLFPSGNGIQIGQREKGVISPIGQMKLLNNNGVISGSAILDKEGATLNISPRSGSGDSGNGIYVTGGIAEINNRGVISGRYISTKPQNLNGTTAIGRNQWVGNGIYSIKTITEMTNDGIISGYSYFDNANTVGGATQESGNGISTLEKITKIINNGTVSGYQSVDTAQDRNGNGIYSAQGIGNMTNNGVIKGSQNAIQLSSLVNSSINNYGILVGKTIIKTNTAAITSANNYNNYGTEVIIDKDGVVKNISVGGVGLVALNGATHDVFNGDNNGNISNGGNYTSNTYISSSKLTDKDDVIINGVGRGDTGALTVDESISLSNSIINGYETALYVEDDKNFTGNNVTFNGGGLKNDIAVIKGDGGANTLNISGNSIINGAVDLGAGNDTLTLDNSVQINGTLTGGTGNDTLNLGLKSSSSSLSIYHDISDFESVNTNGNITVYETADIMGANVNIQSGNLTFRIDPTLKDGDGFITGHAFYQEAVAALDSLDKAASSSPTITSTGGYLVLGLNGLGESSTINMGGYTLIPDIDDKWWKPSDYLTTDSLVLDAKLKDDGNILVTVKESIPLEPPVDPEDPEPPVNPSIDPELYEELNKVYESIVSTGEIGVLADTTLLEGKTYEEALEALLSILDQIYANNPYAYSLKSSRDSLKLFEDNLSYLNIKPKESEWIVQGKGFYSGVKNDSSESGKGYYGFDTSHRNYETKTSFSGGLATAEYGLTNDSSVGFVLGGGHQNTDFKGSSKIKGNTLYLGAFAKKEMNQFRLMSGIGYQYGSLKGERSVSNLYNSFKTDDTYDVNSFNAFVEVKYDYALNNDWTLSPKAKLSWYYVSQDSVNEGYEPGNLSLKVDSAKANTGDLEIGFDLKNTLALNSGKLSNILSAGVINTLGDKEKDLTGNILGAQGAGSGFDIQGIKLPKTSGKLSYNLEYEKTNGMIYTLGIGYEFAKDNNKNITATVGLGYKF